MDHSKFMIYTCNTYFDLRYQNTCVVLTVNVFCLAESPHRAICSAHLHMKVFDSYTFIQLLSDFLFIVHLRV